MRFRVGLGLVLGLMVALLLAGCGLLPGEATPVVPPSLDTVPGIEEAGPLPRYRLDLVLDPAARRLTGRQEVVWTNRSGQPLDEIVFRLYPNLPQYGGRVGIGPVWVAGQRGNSVLRAEDTALAVPLPQPLEPEASVIISLTFDVTIPSRDSGPVLFGRSQGIWSLPDAYPLLAVHDGQRWHEDVAPPQGDAVFAEAALYEVKLTLPSTLTLVTTGSVVTSTSAAAGQTSYHIVGGPLREFAWLAGEGYQVAETAAQGIVVRSYFWPGDEAAGRAVLSMAAAALRVYAAAYGPYPFPEMTVAEAPLAFYGMEYPGLNLIGSALYRDQRAELEDRVAHEIAHQWWYSQVGNDQVNIPWLDEGLAEYSTATYYAGVYGEARANKLINQRWLVPYQVAVEEGRDAVVNRPAAAFGPEYEIIVYGKAALFFDALRRQVGDETYLAILREYVDRFRWRIATPDDFLTVAEEVSGQDLEGLYTQWILSSH